MSDYISREAARPDAFCEGVSCQDCPFCKDPIRGGCRIDDFVKAIPAAALDYIPCWVSVSDRLPEDGEDVLCRLCDDNGEVCATVGCYNLTFKLWDLDAEWASSRHVTHWMPLPALS